VANAVPIPPPGFDNLTPEEKVSYVSALWDRIVEDQQSLPISDAQRALIRQRLAAHQANPRAARPWSEVRREVEQTIASRGSRWHVPNPRFTPDAHADVLQAFEYYNAQSPNLGFEFLDELEDTASIVRETPLIFTIVDPPIRRALVHRFPYGVFYVPGVDGEPDVIVAVLDSRQDPEIVRKAYER